MKRILLLSAMLLMGAGPDPDQFSWQQHPGAEMPMQTAVLDESGRTLWLADFAGHVPMILDFGYFNCPTLCGTVRDDLLNALTQSGLTAGRDYTVLAVSIDPAETPRDAADARARDRAQFSLAGNAAFHYLTASAPAIAALQNAAGFRDRYDARFKQFMHPSGLVILTDRGRISAYLLGVGYQPGDLRAAILRAGGGGIAAAALPILLLCFHFDPSTGRYTLAIMKVLRLMALLTIAMIVALMLLLNRRPRGAGA